jgi:hypothetical protein
MINFTYIEFAPEPRKMSFECSHYLRTSCLPAWNFDAIGCTSGDIDHLFEFWMLECLNWLDKETFVNSIQ